MTALRHAVFITFAAFSLVACSSPDTNTALGLYGDAPLPAINGISADDHKHMAVSAGVVDRTNWPEQTVIVPVRQVEHEPTYGQVACHSCDENAKAMPTVDSAVLVSARQSASPAEPIGETAMFAWNLIASPFKMLFGEYPGKTTSSQSLDAYERR